MTKEKSGPKRLMDDLQAAVRPALKRWGFHGRGRAFNRTTRDGLTQAISLQMGAFDPPGTVSIPGLRENLYGKFTVNLGVYVPEVARHHGGGEAKFFVQEYHCCVRARLGQLGPERADVWWELTPESSVASEIEQRLERDALPFFERFVTRDAILDELLSETKNSYASPPRIVSAIILAEKGRSEEAHRLLVAQAGERPDAGHSAYVRSLAEKLGIVGFDA